MTTTIVPSQPQYIHAICRQLVAVSTRKEAEEGSIDQLRGIFFSNGGNIGLTSPVSVTARHTDGSTGDAHGGRYGDTVLGSEDDGDGGSELHGKPTGGGNQGDTVPKDGHNVVTVRGQTEDERSCSVHQHPDLNL